MLGVIGIGANTLGIWLATRLLADAAAEKPVSGFSSLMTSMGFLLKWPIALGTMLLCWRLGQAACHCYIAGLALVYSRLIGQALWAE